MNVSLSCQSPAACCCCISCRYFMVLKFPQPSPSPFNMLTAPFSMQHELTKKWGKSIANRLNDQHCNTACQSSFISTLGSLDNSCGDKGSVERVLVSLHVFGQGWGTNTHTPLAGICVRCQEGFNVLGIVATASCLKTRKHIIHSLWIHFHHL